VTPRRRCPIARRSVGGPGCQVPGCECMTGPLSSLCSCCLKRHSMAMFAGASELRLALGRSKRRAPISFATNLAKLEALETRVLAEIAAK
jgi:hypothetical protein